MLAIADLEDEIEVPFHTHTHTRALHSTAPVTSHGDKTGRPAKGRPKRASTKPFVAQVDPEGISWSTALFWSGRRSGV